MAKYSTPSLSSSSSSRREDVVAPAPHVGLAHPELHLLVEELHHRQRVRGAAVHAGDRDRAAAADALDGEVEGLQPVDAGPGHHRSLHLLGQQRERLLRGLRDRRAVRLHADRVDDGVGAAAVGRSRTTSGSLSEVTSSRSIVSAPRAPGRASRSGTRSTTMTSMPRSSAIRAAMSPIGPAPMTSREPPAADVGVLHGLPGGRQHVREVEEPVVRRTLRHLDRKEVGERDTQELGLAAGDLAVELAVAEQARPGAVLTVLRGLALAVQTLRAHPAGPAADVEGNDHPVAHGELGDVGADLDHGAHRLVADHVALGHEGCERVVEMEVRAAQAGRGDLDDGIGRLLDHRDPARR